ncbi:dienelactone hydrolase [Stachybotrys elegans]|uniref:Dienelactone hydrolase n=1 Tax=Stachybotrys elegans TaxID=80388 RepID=A0A8K0WUZ0_9HYPO|nr:dienelactone hydrolase [Stachybotrys elegans]
MAKFTNLFTLLLSAASLAAATRHPVADVSAIRHTGKPVGKEIVNDNITLYVTGKRSDTAVLYLTDVFGIQLNENKLLADSFGRAGYLTVAPDLFNGTPAPSDINGTPNFNLTDFLYHHRVEIIDPVIASVVDYIRTDLGVSKIAVTGYCFGGRYAFREIAEGKGADVAFTAHPSLVEESEIEAITKPISIAFAETDDLLPADVRHEYETQLLATGEPYYLSLYSGTQHGFGVRANVSDPEQKFAKEQAFFQAVRFFDTWA